MSILLKLTKILIAKEQLLMMMMMKVMLSTMMMMICKKSGTDMNHCTMMSRVKIEQKRGFLKKKLSSSGRREAVVLCFTLMQLSGSKRRKQTLMKKLLMIGMWTWKYMKTQVGICTNASTINFILLI